jgi:hypothetical protein
MTVRAAIVLAPLIAVAFAAFCTTAMFASHLP